MGKCLTVRDLKDAFGHEYTTVNNLVEGKSENYAFGSLTTIDTNDYFVTVFWGKEDIAYFLKNTGVEPTPENVDRVFSALRESDLNDRINMSNVLLSTLQNEVKNTAKELFGDNGADNVS